MATATYAGVVVTRSVMLVAVAIFFVSCTDSARPRSGRTDGFTAIQESTSTLPLVTQHEEQPTVATGRPELTTRSNPPAPKTVHGTVISSTDGEPIAGATVSVSSNTVMTGIDGSFTLTGVVGDGPVIVERPLWQTVSVDQPVSNTVLLIELAPLLVKGLRVSREVAADRVRFDELLALADDSVVNALVFDTKDESGTVLYETEVGFAHKITAVDAVYEPTELLAKAKQHDLYTITRIVTFEDARWIRAEPDAKLAGVWVDPANRDNWDYPIDLAVEACQLGFDEIQFDYIRFPAGQTAVVAAALMPATSEERAVVIAEFLGEARTRLDSVGCGISAAVFGIVMSSETDEGVGQTVESVSAVVDALSPMLYPSHYGPGWLGFADPNDHPGPVVAHSLDAGADRMASATLMRPWLQGFYYSSTEVLAQIREADQRGAGWILWNASGNYKLEWLPSS